MIWVLHGALHMDLSHFSGSFRYNMGIYSPILDVFAIALCSVALFRMFWLQCGGSVILCGHWQHCMGSYCPFLDALVITWGSTTLFWVLLVLSGISVTLSGYCMGNPSLSSLGRQCLFKSALGTILGDLITARRSIAFFWVSWGFHFNLLLSFGFFM